jgi:hypothetical protein
MIPDTVFINKIGKPQFVQILCLYYFPQEVLNEICNFDEGGTESVDSYTCFYGNGNAHHIETGFFVHKGIIAVVTREEFVHDRMSYIRGCWCDMFILNVHAPTKDKSDDKKDKLEEPRRDEVTGG